MKQIIDLLTLMVIAVLVAGLVTNARGTARVINAIGDFMARGFQAQLGVPPRTSTAERSRARRR